jgi:GDP-L-fucose synthase
VGLLVTGGSGFLGRHVLAALARRGEYAKNRVFHPTRKEMDLLDVRSVGRWFERHKPSRVIHLAANCGGIGKNVRLPGELWRDNLLMGVYILEAARVYGVSKLVMLSTTCAYPKDAPTPFREEDLWNGYPEATNAPYAIAKRALMEGGKALRKQCGLPVVTLIPTNLYGPWDHFDPEDSHVVPALIRKVEESSGELTLWGTGKATRDFVYAGDAAGAVLRALDVYDGEAPINLGSGVEISIGELAVKIAAVMGKPGLKINFDRTKPDGQPRRVLDTSRAMKHLGWMASTTLEEGLRFTVEWWRANKETEIRTRG